MNERMISGAARRARSHAVLLTLMSSCAALVFGMGASLNLAIDHIATSALHPSASQVLWIIDSYLVVFGCMMIPSGAIGDRYGRKGVLLGGLGLLAIGSLWSGLAGSIPLLLVGRGMAGAGAALVLPNSLAVLVQRFDEAQRPHAIAVWTASGGLGGALGNLVGGLVLQYLAWQMLFIVAVPLALIGLLMAARVVPRLPTHDHALDGWGTVLLALAVFALLRGLIETQQAGWDSLTAGGMFVLSVALGAGFLVVQSRRRYPLIAPEIFRSRGLLAGMLGIVVSTVDMYSLFYLNGQYLMSGKGYAPLLAGVCVLPLVATVFWVSPRSLRLAGRIGARVTLLLGLLTLLAGLGLLSCCRPDSSYAFYALAIAVIGIGSGLSNPLLSVAVVSSLPGHRAGLGSGLNSFSREIGGALGVALFGSLLGSALQTRLARRLPDLPASARHSVSTALRALPDSEGARHILVRHLFTEAMSDSLHVVIAATLVAGMLVVLCYPARSGSGTKGRT